MQTDEIKKQFVDMGLEPIGKGNLKELRAFVTAETARWAPVIRNAGLAGTQ
jgi:tripartite-type tricarboxylate transporter receptor subunit TctC